MNKRFLLWLLAAMTALQLSAATSGRTDYCDWSVSADNVLTITTRGKKLPDFSKSNPSPWTQYHRDYAQYGQYITAIITDAPNISQYCFAELKEVSRFEAPKATTVGTAAFTQCGMPGFTLVLPNVETMDNFAFMRCNAGVIALPKITIVKQGFYECPYLKQVDLGENLTEIERNSFMYCPMMWLDAEPNVFLSCKKAPKINRGHWLPKKDDVIGYTQWYFSNIGGSQLPDSLSYTKAFHYGTCFDDESLYGRILFPYNSPGLPDSKSSVFFPRPDGDDFAFTGMPKIVIPEDADIETDADGWVSLMSEWEKDVKFVKGGRVMIKDDVIHAPYTGYWIRDNESYTGCDLTINTYEWELADYITEDDAYSIYFSKAPVFWDKGYDPSGDVAAQHDNMPKGMKKVADLLSDYKMPWYNTVRNFTIHTLIVRTPKILPFMFGPALYNDDKIILENITEIGSWAFACSALTGDINFGKQGNSLGVSKIGRYAFLKNNSMTEVVLPEIEHLGYYVFSDCAALKKVVLGDNIAFTTIPHSAFYGCKELEEVHVGKYVTMIEGYAFAYTNLRNEDSEKGLFMAAAAPALDKKVFANEEDEYGELITTGLDKIYCHIPEEYYKSYDEDGSLWQKMNRVSELVFPLTGDGWELTKDGILYITKNIGDMTSSAQQPWAKYRRYIKTIDIKEGVTEIGNNAFCFTAEESHLYQVWWPSTLKRIGNYAFAGHDELTRFGWSESGEFYLPDELEEIGDYAFANCSMMWSVTLGEKTAKIGKYFVQGCPISEINTYSATPPTVDRYTFEGTVDYYYGDVQSPNKIKCGVNNYDFEVQLTYMTTAWWKDLQYELGDLEVWYSEKMYGGKFILTSDSVMHIMAYSESGHVLDGTFDGDGHDGYGKPQSIGGGILNETSIVGWDREVAHSSWYDFGSKNKVADKVKRVEVHEGVTFLGGACCFMPNLQRVSMAKSVKQLWNTFFECPRLDSVYLPHVQYLGGTSISSLTGRTTDLGKMDANHDYKSYRGVFAHCSGMRSIHMPEVTYVGDSAFCGCTNLNDGHYNYSIDTIGSYAYARCTSIYGFDAENVKQISGGHNFSGCTYLYWVDLGNNAPSYGMFEGCTYLEEVTLGEQISQIGNKAFLGCPVQKIWCRTPNPPSFDLNAKETVRDHIFGGVPLGEIKVYTYGDFIDHYRNAKGWQEMAVTVGEGYEKIAAIPAAGWIGDQNWTNKAKWELITSGTLNFYGEGATPDADMDPRLKHYSEYIKEVRVQDGITQITKPLWQYPLHHDNYPDCHKVYIPATMEKMCIGTFCTDLIFKNSITDVYCYAENPVDISYEKYDYKEMYGLGAYTHSSAWGVLIEYYEGEDMEKKNAEAREGAVIPRLHVLMKKGVKEAYEAAPGYKYAFNEIIADLSETDEVALPKQYAVTFLGYNDTWIETQVINEGDAATAPADPEQEGHTFIGWDKTFDNVTGDLTVKATFNVLSYLVSFVDWDDKVLKSDEVPYGTAATPPDDPEREGYIFKGWDISFKYITGETTVKAVYEAKTYTVTFLDWDATELLKETVQEGGDAKGPETNPEREGYDFIGWSKPITGITGDLTVIAQYEKAKEHFTVTYLDWNGDELYKEDVIEGEDAKGPATNPTRDGYTFTGWSKPLTHITGNMIVVAQYGVPSGTEDVSADGTQSRKLLINGVLYIEHNGRRYDTTGRVVLR